MQHDEPVGEEVVQRCEQLTVCCQRSPVMHRQRREVRPPWPNGWAAVVRRHGAQERVAIEGRRVSVAEGHVGERAVTTGIDDLQVDRELMGVDEPLCADEIDLRRILAALPEPERRERDQFAITSNGNDRSAAFSVHDELLHDPRLCPPAGPVRATGCGAPTTGGAGGGALRRRSAPPPPPSVDSPRDDSRRSAPGHQRRSILHVTIRAGPLPRHRRRSILQVTIRAVGGASRRGVSARRKRRNAAPVTTAGRLVC